MFDDIPTDVPDQYLSGLAAFVASNGERTEGMERKDYVYVLNECAGVGRVAEGDGRSNQSIVDKSEADEDDLLGPSEYSDNIFIDEISAWTDGALENEDVFDSEDN